MSRTYAMDNRGRLAAATRGRIIQATHDLLGRPDGGTLSLNDVAAQAGVSRATIYNSIGSRSELLTAVFVDQGRLIDFGRVLNAMELREPDTAVVETVRESCRAWTVMPVAIRRTLALAVIDKEIGRLVSHFEVQRRKKLNKLARRIKRASAIDHLTTREITMILTIHSAFPTFDQLLLSIDEKAATRQLVRMTKLSIGI